MIEWIVTSSALILLVLVLRAIIKDRVSPRLRYALWGLVLLRLVIPVSLWESPASVMTPVAAQEAYQEIERVPRYVRERPDGWVEIGHPNSGNYTSIPAESAAADRPARYEWFSPSEDVSLETLREQVSVRNAFLLVWLAGSVLMGAFLLAVNLKFSRDLKKKRRTAGKYEDLWVFVMDGLATPCLFGLPRPGIYLTPSLSEAEKPHVLAHEYAHFRQRDHIWAILRGVCLAIHWYNPLVWLAAALSRRDCELSCDEGAIRLLGEEQRADYGRTLVGLVARRTTAADLACCATTMTGGKSALKERVALLVKRPRTTAVMACIVAAACMVFAVCTFTGAAEAEDDGKSVDEPQNVDLPVRSPSLEELPAEVIDAYTLGDLAENTDPYWLLDQVYGEDIALYGVNPMGEADEIRGIYLRYGEHLQYFDQVASPYILTRPHLTWYDFDGDGENELLVVYTVLRGTTVDIDELVVYEWEENRWSEHKYDPAGLIEDFNANAEFESDGDISRISYRGASTQVALGGEECFIGGGVVTYTLHGKEGWGILLTLAGEIGPTLTSHNYAFEYMCDISYNADGAFTESGGVFSSFYLPEDVALLPLPDDLPTEFMDMSRPAEEQGEWLLLAEWREGDAALYRTNSDDGKVYLRWGEEFQMFEQDLSRLDMLPEIERASYGEGWGIAVWYKRHEGTYFNGESYEPGVVADYVLYGREDGYWKACSPSTGRLEPYLPALEDLPTTLTPDIQGRTDPILMIAQLPEEDIAIYYDQQSFYPGSLIRYGDHLQRVEETLEGRYPPELTFEDLDGDGEKELAVTYNSGVGTGTFMTGLVVYEWDGESWTGHTANLELDIIDDFNASHTFTLYPEEGRAVVGYDGSEVDVDMAAMFPGGTEWMNGPLVCEMMGTICNYRQESYGLILEILGEIRPAGYAPTTSYGFGYICYVYYETDGTFRSPMGYLDTDYQWYPKADASRLTPAFRRILRDFIDERRQRWGRDADLSGDKFAIRDVNGDGKDELITQVNNDIMAGQVELVYDANGKELLAEYPAVTYYDNGYAVAEWSHNQGRAGDKLWPYTLLRYDAAAGEYVRIAAVDGWDKSLGDRNLSYTGGYIPYPDDVDKDGDGFVYYIITEEGGYAPEYGEPMDYSDYALWAASFLGGNAVDVSYVPLTEENIALIQ